MVPKRRSLGLALGVVLSSLACAPHAADGPGFAPPTEPMIRLTVDNRDYRDATIYANWNGVRQRVGMVVGKTTRTFTTEWRDHRVRLEVDFVGGGELRADRPVSVFAGDHLDFIIPPGW